MKHINDHVSLAWKLVRIIFFFFFLYFVFFCIFHYFSLLIVFFLLFSSCFFVVILLLSLFFHFFHPYSLFPCLLHLISFHFSQASGVERGKEGGVERGREGGVERGREGGVERGGVLSLEEVQWTDEDLKKIQKEDVDCGGWGWL